MRAASTSAKKDVKTSGNYIIGLVTYHRCRESMILLQPGHQSRRLDFAAHGHLSAFGSRSRWVDWGAAGGLNNNGPLSEFCQP